MKNIFNYLAVVAILFMGIMFASCSKDKDDASGSDSGSVSDNLIGWYANFNSILSASDL